MDKRREPTNYEGKIEDSRLKDFEGDLGYTIHINSARKICLELEQYYLKKIESILKFNNLYTENDVKKAYYCGKNKQTYYFKDTTVILPDGYQGVDG